MCLPFQDTFCTGGLQAELLLLLLLLLLLQVATYRCSYTDDPYIIKQYQKWGMCMLYGECGVIKTYLDDLKVAVSSGSGATCPARFCC
jgi:hypothetical protein